MIPYLQTFGQVQIIWGSGLLYQNNFHHFSCTHTDSVRLSEHPYHGQVRLMNSNTSRSSYGRVEIYQGNEWGSVCGRDINQVAADTVCRQLGYTGAISTQEA